MILQNSLYWRKPLRRMAGSSRLPVVGAAALLLCAAPAARAQLLGPVNGSASLTAVTTPELEDGETPPGEDPALDTRTVPVPSDPSRSQPADPAGPKVKALSAILVDGRTGAVLWEKDARTRRAMASTTKIMTASLLLERANLADTVVASKRAAATQY